MDLIGRGILWGLLLTIMVGPILIGLIQTSLEKGWQQGLRVGGGVWISDFLFIALCYWFTKPLEDFTHGPNFNLWLGLVGGAVLAIIGVALLFKKATQEKVQSQFSKFKESNFASWTKGFLINTINPFTFIFWITLSLTVVAKEKLAANQALSFYLSIMMVVIAGDVLKVFLANKIRPWLTPKHINQIRMISGVAFIIFGIVMVARVM